MSVNQETVIYAEAEKLGINVAPAKVFAVKIGAPGFIPIYGRFAADSLNTPDVTPEIVESAVAGSMFGWDCPAAQLAVKYAEGE